MMKLGIVALGLVSLALAAMVGLELRSGRKPAALPAASATLETASAKLPPAVAIERQDKAWVEIVLARPVFSPSRRPPSVARVAQAAAVQAKLPRLAGIMVDGARRSVIFAPEGDRKPIIVAEGGEFDGYRVERIEDGRVTVSGPGLRQVLRPSFNPNAPPPPPPIAAAITPVPVPQAPAFNGPPGLDRMPALVAPGQGPVTPTLPGLPSLSGLTGIPGLGPQTERYGR